MNDIARILSHEIGGNLRDGGSAGLRPAFEQGLVQAHDSAGSMNLQKKPARLNKNGLQSGNAQFDGYARRIPLPRGRSARIGLGFPVTAWFITQWAALQIKTRRSSTGNLENSTIDVRAD